MKYLVTLLLALLTIQVEGATSAIVNALRRNYDTTGTNTTTSAVTVSGGAGTNLYAGTLNATNSVNVGVAGQAGLITLTSTNGTYSVTIGLASDGTLQVKYGTTNMLTVLVGSNAGHTGTGTNVLTDGGYYTNLTGGATINPTNGFVPFRTNSTTFLDSAIEQLSPTSDKVHGELFVNQDTFHRQFIGTSTEGDLPSMDAATDYIIGIGVAPFAATTIVNSTHLTSMGDVAFGVSAVTDSTLVNAYGTYALQGGADVTSSANVDAFGQFSMNNADMETSTAISAFGFSSLDNGSVDNSTFVQAFGPYAGYNAKLTNVSHLLFVGPRAGENTVATGVTNAFALGPLASLPTISNAGTIGGSALADLYIPNALHFDRSATNVLYRSGSDLVYTNGDTSPKLSIINGTGKTANISLDSSGNAIFSSPAADAKLEAPTGFEVRFRTDSTDRWQVDQNGHLDTIADNNYDIGGLTGSGRNAPRVIYARSGFSSEASDTTVALTSTGWTNSFAKQANVNFEGTNVTYTIINSAGLGVYTNTVTTGVISISRTLQPGGKLIVTSGTIIGDADAF